MVSKYCVCLITENVKGNTLWEGCETRLDAMTFPNPDKDQNAIQRCYDRAVFLRQVKYPNPDRFAIVPVIITGL